MTDTFRRTHHLDLISMFPRLSLIKSLLFAVAVAGTAAFASGCAEGGASDRSDQLGSPPITGVDELQTIGDFLAKLKTLTPAYKKASFLLVRAKVEKNLQMVAEANFRPGVSPEERTDVIKLAAAQAATLKMVADAANWPEMAEVYSESSEAFQAMVRGELEKDRVGETASGLESRTQALMKEFLSKEAHAVGDARGLDAFADRFGAALIANTKAYAWNIDTSKLK